MEYNKELDSTEHFHTVIHKNLNILLIEFHLLHSKDISIGSSGCFFRSDRIKDMKKH